MTQTGKDEFTLSAQEAASLRQGFRYCPRCRSEMIDKEVYGRLRRVCPNDACRFVQFIDPKVSSAVIALRAGQVLLVKRAMDPARGSWCLPSGFIEIGETPQQAAIRECKEETGYEVVISALVDVFSYEDYRGSGVLIMYRGQVVGGQAQPGEDALEARFFGPDELPDNIVFDTNLQILTAWREGRL